MSLTSICFVNVSLDVFSVQRVQKKQSRLSRPSWSAKTSSQGQCNCQSSSECFDTVGCVTGRALY